MCKFDRAQASNIIADAEQNGGYSHTQLLDALAECVTDKPQSIDRDALVAMFDEMDDFPRPDEVVAIVDRILALFRPDPRIFQLQAAVNRGDRVVTTHELRAILRGDQ